jgi:hypothetical protein
MTSGFASIAAVILEPESIALTMEVFSVQVRTLASDGAKSVWRTLTPGKLSEHVEQNTVVAQWLEHRMGWRRLLLACVGEQPASDSRSDSYQAA